MLNVLHVTEDHSFANTGVTAAVDQLSARLAKSLGSNGSAHICAIGDAVASPCAAVEMTLLPVASMGRAWRWSGNLPERLAALVSAGQTGVVHLHGVWMAPQLVAGKVANAQRVPFVLSAHGMLAPWLWDKQGWRIRLKKKLYWWLAAYPAFKTASVVHAVTPRERDYLQPLFPGQRIEVIPNAIDVAEVDANAGLACAEPARTILFLGRLHPVKGVDLLIQAFAAAELGAEWRVVVAGPAESPGYLDELKALAATLHVQDRIDFVGPVLGEEKWRRLKQAWVLAAPSYSEAMGMVNLEAASCHTPTITTHETGLWDWEKGGGVLIQPAVQELQTALRAASRWSLAERAERGRASRRLVELRYSWEVVEQQWLRVYRELAAEKAFSGVPEALLSRQGDAGVGTL